MATHSNGMTPSDGMVSSWMLFTDALWYVDRKTDETRRVEGISSPRRKDTRPALPRSLLALDSHSREAHPNLVTPICGTHDRAATAQLVLGPLATFSWDPGAGWAWRHPQTADATTEPTAIVDYSGGVFALCENVNAAFTLAWTLRFATTYPAEVHPDLARTFSAASITQCGQHVGTLRARNTTVAVTRTRRDADLLARHLNRLPHASACAAAIVAAGAHCATTLCTQGESYPRAAVG
jgi:hypothetical protein